MKTSIRLPHASEVEILLSVDNGVTLEGGSFLVPVVRVPGARPLWCTENAPNLARTKGGEVVHCFDLTVTANRFIEIEPHLITALPDGTFVDPTPHPLSFSEICVIRSKTPFGVKLPPNRIISLSDDPMDVMTARYYSAAHEIISPVLRPGEKVTFTSDMVAQMVREYRVAQWPTSGQHILQSAVWTLIQGKTHT